VMDPIAVVVGIQGAMDCVRGLSEALKAVKETDNALSMLNIREQLVELKEKLIDAKELAIEQDQEIKKLRNLLQLKDEVQHDEDGNILWRIIEGQKRGPYCSTCYGSEDKLISLSENDPGAWHCPNCENHFHTRQWNERQKQKLERLNQSFGR